MYSRKLQYSISKKKLDTSGYHKLVVEYLFLTYFSRKRALSLSAVDSSDFSVDIVSSC